MVSILLQVPCKGVYRKEGTVQTIPYSNLNLHFYLSDSNASFFILMKIKIGALSCRESSGENRPRAKAVNFKLIVNRARSAALKLIMFGKRPSFSKYRRYSKFEVILV